MLEVTHGSQVFTPHHVALILDGEQSNGGAGEAWQVALIELREGLMVSPLQSVIEVIAYSRGEPGRHAQVGGMSRDVHVDLAASMPKLVVWAATVRGSPRVAEMVQHIPEQGRKAGTVQHVPEQGQKAAMKSSVGPDSGVGLVVHLSKSREKRINISSIK
jgi:hypothetical protein